MFDNKQTCITTIYSKLTYGHFGHNCRDALLFTKYITAKGIILQSLKWVGQFLH